MHHNIIPLQFHTPTCSSTSACFDNWKKDISGNIVLISPMSPSYRPDKGSSINSKYIYILYYIGCIKKGNLILECFRALNILHTEIILSQFHRKTRLLNATVKVFMHN